MAKSRAVPAFVPPAKAPALPVSAPVVTAPVADTTETVAVAEPTKESEVMPDNKPFNEMSLEELKAVDQAYLTEDELGILNKFLKKLSPPEPVVPEPVADLRKDGPTLEEWLNRGYKQGDYPPKGYAVRESLPPESAMTAEARRIAESREALKHPISPNQQFFEAPDGTIVLGNITEGHIWFGRLNGGKGGWINPRR